VREPRVLAGGVPEQGHEMLFDAHTRSFAALGGVARGGIYDNMKTAVDEVHKVKPAPSTRASR
jgi:transposase